MSDGTLLLTSGWAGGGVSFADVWTSTDTGVTWTEVSLDAGFPARQVSAAVVLPDDSVLLMGGQDDNILKQGGEQGRQAA